ncbi:hypothetical protein DMJ13_09250 [halophilic archaeon]|nr:hypothetical protein DMJ13_09250 [halophilic archaeon]
MSSALVSRWARRTVAVGAVFLVAWQLVVLAAAAGATSVGRSVGAHGFAPAVVLGLYGFVLHVVFGKAYSLVPAYFDRELAFARAPAVQLPLTAGGAALLALSAAGVRPSGVDRFGGLDGVGAVLWAAGVAVFLGTLAWTVRTNPTGGETGTGEANAHRRGVDRAANAVVPAAFAYLAVGTYETLALATGLPTLFVAYAPQAAHLLGAGFAALVLFAVGFRLLPRFLVASPPRALVAVVLPAGALGPLLLAVGFLRRGPWFRTGAVLEATAVGGFALAYAVLFVRTDRDRVGFYGVLAGTAFGVVGVAVGLWFAFRGVDASLTPAHRRANLLGFLGLTVVGVAYQFYPPAVGRFPGAGDRTALASIAALAGGLGLELLGLAAGAAGVVLAGASAAAAGAVAAAYLVLGLFVQRTGS